MNNSSYKYYGNFDRNIKAIKGGGVITPSNPPNKKTTTDTIKNTWSNNINHTPPTNVATYYSNPDLTNGYLNSKNYISKNKYINDYYYPSQKFNKVSFDVNNTNDLIFPPPLITTKNNYSNNSKLSKSIEKPNEQTTSNKLKVNKSKISKKNITELSNQDKQIIEYIKNNSLYDGKYIYTIEKPQDYNNKQIKNIDIIPIMNYKKNYGNLNDSYDIENFNTKNNKILDSNFIMFIIFSILLIFYFLKNQK